MKILFICNKGEIGGATKSLLTLLEHLKSMDITPIVLTPNKNGKVKEFCEKNKIKCVYIKYFEIGYSFNTSIFRKIIKYILLPFFYIFNKFYNPILIKKIEKKIDFNDIDLIHTNVNRDNFGILLAQKYNIKNIMHLREYGTLDFKCKYLKRNIYKYFNENVDYFIAISNSINKFYVGNGIDSQKIHTIYNGVDSHKIEQRKYDQEKEDTFKIIVLSGISREKGQVQIIDALNLINEEIKNKIKVYFYGSGNKRYINKLKKKISSKGLNDNFIFVGYKDNVYSEIKNYNLAITPSKSEAFGRVTVEYMFANIPVIVSDTGANPEIVKNNVNGLIYGYNNVQDLANKIEYLFNNKEIRSKYSTRAYIDAKGRFDSLINAQNIKKKYEEIVYEDKC